MYAGISCKQAQVVNASRCNKTKTKITPTRLKKVKQKKLHTKKTAHAPDAVFFSLRIASEHAPDAVFFSLRIASEHAPDAVFFSLRIASEHTSRSAQLKSSTAFDGAEGFCLSAPFEISSTQTQHRS
jgi:hypothetical protein